MGAPPSTPTPRRFLVPKRPAQKPVDSTPAATAPKFFSSTPRFGSTQRGIEDVEDVDSAEESETNNHEEGKDEIADSIEVNDGAVLEDDTVPDSIGVQDYVGEQPVDLDADASSQDGREIKRRRLSASIPSSDEDSRDNEEQQQEEVELTPAPQPVFRPPPRFKQVAGETYEALPDVFSPQRKGAKYVAGGLAAELQGWLSDVKGGQEDVGDAEQARFTVEEVKPGTRMYLVRGTFEGDKRNVILAGEGKLTGLGRRVAVEEGSRVALGRLGWEIVMDDEEWAQRAATTWKRSLTTSASEPLRILFCGSDEFSCASLKALHAEHETNKSLVESLEVMVLPGKRTGRGFKQLREVPCKSLADELGLQIHQRPTFRDWDLPRRVNLIVVVSFGLFVPKRILGTAKYGGLNVHPSLLPDLRGPAPIHHAILRGDEYTGVSLQTLDDKAFDHGTVLAQTPSPGVPIPPDCTVSQLTEQLGTIGAEMLVQGLRDGVHVPPTRDAGWMASRLASSTLTHAPKVNKAAAEVDWDRWTTVEDWSRRMRVFGSVWTMGVTQNGQGQGKEKRVLFLDAEGATAGEVDGTNEEIVFARGKQAMKVDEKSGKCFVKAGDGWVCLKRVKVDGKGEQSSVSGMKPFKTGKERK